MKKKNFSIRPQDCMFIVDEENRKVVCVLEDTKYYFLDYINAHCALGTAFDDIFSSDKITTFIHRLYMPNRFVGIATCSDNDEWDEQIGRAIAFSRLKDKVTKSFFKRANTYFNVLDRWLDDAAFTVDALGEKLERNQQHRHNYIAKLVGEPPQE